MPISGAVLAGGRGRRLGESKAGVRLGDTTLLRRAIATMRKVSDDVLVAGGDFAAGEADCVFATDPFPNAGSLGGIYAALRRCRFEHCLVVACDMPFLQTHLLSYLADLAPGYDVVMPEHGGRLEPLHAVYGRACLPSIERLLNSGQRKILDFLPEIRLRRVAEVELRRFDPNLNSFFNINWPADLATARQLLSTTTGSVP